MRYPFKIFLAAAAALAIVSCGKEAQPEDVGNNEVKFTAEINPYAVKASDTAFENGDEIGIFAGAPIGKDNYKAVISGKTVTLSNPINWVDGNTSAVEFSAYYPYVSSAKKALSFSVQKDQSTKAAYAKGDLLIASTQASPTRKAVALEFHHALSKMTITIENQVAGTSVTGVEVVGVATGGTVDIASGEISGLTSAQTITPLRSGSLYKLLLMPQTATPTIRVSLSDGHAYLFNLESAFTFAAGMKYSASLVVLPAPVEATFSFTVQDWDDGTEALEYGDPEKQSAYWGVVGLGDDWNNDIVMTKTASGSSEAEGIWEADITYTVGESFKLRLNGGWAVNAGMQEGWTFYGTGEFEDGILVQDGQNIVLEASGQYHLKFTYPSYKFVVTLISGQ